MLHFKVEPTLTKHCFQFRLGLKRMFASCSAVCQSARMEQAYVLTGELRDGRSVMLDEAVPLAAGNVRVTVEAIDKAPPVKRPAAEVLEEIWAAQNSSGRVPPTKEEIDRFLEEERNSWD